jgi:hypothetical protein
MLVLIVEQVVPIVELVVEVVVVVVELVVGLQQLRQLAFEKQTKNYERLIIAINIHNQIYLRISNQWYWCRNNIQSHCNTNSTIFFKPHYV